MRKLFVLLKKEIKELLTPMIIFPFALMMGAFALMGQFFNLEELGTPKIEGFKIVWIDEDQSNLSQALEKKLLERGFTIEKHSDTENFPQAAISFAREKKALAIVKIPPKFAANLRLQKMPELEIYNLVSDFSISSSMNSGKVDDIKLVINDFLTYGLIEEKLPEVSSAFLRNPFKPLDFVVVNDKHANISFSQVSIFVQSQNTVVPILLIMVIVIASQMVAVAVASEKENKTFEILLSSPVNRKAIVAAKVLAAAIVALLFSSIYIIGFNSYMSGFGIESQAVSQSALSELGVVIAPYGYLLIALSLFLATLCALAIAIILGILAEDVKGVQMVTAPLVIFVIIPYLMSLFTDVNSLPFALKYLIYLIPFSHPFLALNNAMTGGENLIVYGLVYQALVFMALILLASRIFSTDKVLTFKIKWAKN